MSEKIYWKSVEQLDKNNVAIQKIGEKEFAEEIPVEDFLGDKATLENSNTNRRDFLKYVGFSTAAAAVAACEGPVVKSVPYVVQPERIRPGVSNYYATAIADGFDFASVLVKTREGRPIKIENNQESPLFGKGNARVHASVLGLYDILRLQGPKAFGEDISWENFNTQIKARLNALKATGKKVVILTQTFASPTTQKIIKNFQKSFPNVAHIVYDTVSESATLDAFETIYGKRALPDYHFEKADLIVSFGADILGDWQGGGFSSAYAKTRVPTKSAIKAKMSFHLQLEANMTLSGANADKRIPLTPSQQRAVLLEIYSKITNKNSTVKLNSSLEKIANNIVSKIKKAGSKALVITGIEDKNLQMVALAINHYIKSKVIDSNAPRYVRQGDTKKVTKLVQEIENGEISGLITMGVNPCYTLPNAKSFQKALKKIDLSVSFSMKEDETALSSQYIAALPHYLESWGDYEFKKGHYFLAQPTIRPLFDTQAFQDVLLGWTDNSKTYYEVIKENWKENILKGASWNKTLQNGFFIKAVSPSFNFNKNVNVLENINYSNFSKKEGTMELLLYTQTGMGDGRQANNPWLQEFPDPITRVSWDNYLTISLADAKNLGIKNKTEANGALNGNYANVVVNGENLKVPVFIQPGQAEGSLGLSLGYGSKEGLKNEMKTGVNAFLLYKDFSNVQMATISSTDAWHKFACVQLQNTLMGRGDIIKETTLEIFNTKDKEYWNPVPKVSKNHIETPVNSPEVSIWKEFGNSVGHHFNLSIDLNACTGCGACVIACHAENNVPVVGKNEVRKSRDMHWLRIDRYYSSETTFREDEKKKEETKGLTKNIRTLSKLEKAAANPQVAFQPVMCQHCNHAPCETVCPVAATSHGRQGQNQMAYNRCVGTRYCANNCPYKVRRFNWFLYNKNDEFDYHMNNDLGRMVLNPDVVVRSRGVMEKCSMCIQKTQKTILDAKREGRQIKDGEFQTACSSACGNGAIVFGDINDKESEILKLKENERAYHLLESVGTKPNVVYQTKVRNS